MKNKIIYMLFSIVIVLSISISLFILWSKQPQHFVIEQKVEKSLLSEESNDYYSLITHNVRYFSDSLRSGNTQLKIDRNIKSALELYNNYDIVLLQEIDRKSNRTYNLDQHNILSTELAYPTAIFHETYNKNYVPYPYKNHYKNVLSGQSLFTKFQLKHHGLISLPQLNKPLKKNNTLTNKIAKDFYPNRIFSYYLLEINSQKVLIGNIHLENQSSKVRISQAKKIIDFLSQYKKIPIIIAGDFNSISFKKLDSLDEEKLNWFKNDSTIKLFKKFGFKTNHELKTFPSWSPELKYDYIMSNKYILPLERGTIKTNISDHLPITFKFKIDKP